MHSQMFGAVFRTSIGLNADPNQALLLYLKLHFYIYSFPSFIFFIFIFHLHQLISTDPDPALDTSINMPKNDENLDSTVL